MCQVEKHADLSKVLKQERRTTDGALREMKTLGPDPESGHVQADELLSLVPQMPASPFYTRGRSRRREGVEGDGFDEELPPLVPCAQWNSAVASTARQPLTCEFRELSSQRLHMEKRKKNEEPDLTHRIPKTSKRTP